ncbi:hypothetical protein BH09BAC6_BH09BAC6_10090 [soil metagenome]|jgi:DNA-binding transcriptional ArsR family regulator
MAGNLRPYFYKKYLRNRTVSLKLQPFGYIMPDNVMRRDVFQAIADPTRRAIISMIANQSLNLNSVAESFDVSRPAISKHIKILTECGLIEIKQRGRERFCEAKLQPLKEVSAWVEEYRKFWTVKLDALGDFLALETTPTGKERSIHKSKTKKK